MQVTLFFYIRAEGVPNKQWYAKKKVDLPSVPRIGETVCDMDAVSSDDEAKKVVNVRYDLGDGDQILVCLQDETAESAEEARA